MSHVRAERAALLSGPRNDYLVPTERRPPYFLELERSHRPACTSSIAQPRGSHFAVRLAASPERCECLFLSLPLRPPAEHWRVLSQRGLRLFLPGRPAEPERFRGAPE